jgi:hypothetical protein
MSNMFFCFFYPFLYCFGIVLLFRFEREKSYNKKHKNDMKEKEEKKGKIGNVYTLIVILEICFER